ncbi:MAG: hypothetical protein ACPGJV_16035, partial [Bacteriovoracaceae bacterium]
PAPEALTNQEVDIEYVSPMANDVFTQALKTKTAAETAYNIIPASFIVQKSNALTAKNKVDSSYDEAQSANDQVKLAAAILKLSEGASEVASAAMEVTDDTATFVQGNVTENEASILLVMQESLANRCLCAGGTCKTLAYPRANQFGSTTFRYQITDNKGRKTPFQEVLVDIKGVNDAPFIQNHTVDVQESPTALAPIGGYPFVIPASKDLDDIAIDRYEITKLPTKGAITNCFGLNGSSLLDTSCAYTPFDGDGSGVGIKSNFILNGINFVAAAPGVWGDTIKVQFLHRPGLGNQPEVLLGSREITIYAEVGKTTAQDVYLAMSINPYLSTLFDFETVVDPIRTELLNSTLTIAERTEYLRNGKDPYDIIEYRAYDGKDYSEHSGVIGININSEADPPRILVSNIGTASFTEDEEKEIEVLWLDPEGSNAISCLVSPLDPLNPDFVTMVPCSCDLATPAKCTFKLRPLLDRVSPFSYKVSLTVDDGRTTEENLIAIVNPVNDLPVPMMKSFLVSESDTVSPLEYDLTTAVNSYDATDSGLDTAFDAEGETSLTYTLISGPSNGTLTGCLGQGAPGITGCRYTPFDGNYNKIGTKGTLTIGPVFFETKFHGTEANNISITISQDPFLSAGEIRVQNTAFEITVHVPPSMQAGPFVEKFNDFNTNKEVPLFILAKLKESAPAAASTDPIVLSSKTNFSNGTDGADKVTYSVSDSGGTSLYTGVIGIDISATDDKPILCEYSEFSDAPECGVNGCIGTSSPVGKITPSSTGTIYYHLGNSVCYRSNGLTNQDWEILASNIFDQSINEKDQLIIDSIVIDEGGGNEGIGDEDSQTLAIINVTSSNENLVPLGNIVFDWNGSDNVWAGSDVNLTAGSGVSEDEADFKIKIFPQSGKILPGDTSAQSTITFTYVDKKAGVATVGNEVTAQFVVTVNSLDAIHNGWNKIVSFGPKTDKNDVDLETRLVCNYHRDKCEVSGSGNRVCTSLGNPKNLNYRPQEKGTLFYDSSGDKCYYSTGTTTDDWVEFSSTCNISHTAD